MKPGPKNPQPKHGAHCGFWNRKAALNHTRKTIRDLEDALCHARRVEERLKAERTGHDRRDPRMKQYG